MSDYGMCCGENEARDCIKEYNLREEYELKILKLKNKLILMSLLFLGILFYIFCSPLIYQ